MKRYLVVVAVVAIVLALSLMPLAFAKPGGDRGAKACNDKIDNDGDTYTDYPADPGCSSKQDNSELNPAIECDDGVDNDADTYTDYPDDPDCSSPTDDDEMGVYECNDGVNNDYDGLIDYPADPGCTSANDRSELGTVQCDNGIDDDSDTYFDYPADPQCDSPTDNSEGVVDSCSDTDGGDNIWMQGTASGYYQQQPYSYTDGCTTINATLYLDENYCSGAYRYYSMVDCSWYDGNETTYTCLNGACVEV